MRFRKAELRRLAFFAAGAAGEVATDDAELAPRRVEARLHPAALGVELGVTDAGDHIAGLLAGVQADARIALLLRVVEMPPQTGHLVQAAGYVIGLRLDLLHAHTICCRAFGPGHEALVGRRTDTVEVERDEPESQGSPLQKNMSSATDPTLAQEFVHFAVQSGVLRFGEFKTKAGRLSPYFFNAGLFDDGAKLGRLAEFYARRLLASPLAFDLLFGPAYKGITLAAAVAVELARRGPQRALCLQPQGSQGSRRRRPAGRRAGGRPRSGH
jgi:hypothetical protein